MGLDVPDLDDRRFEDLMADARKRIPVHDPEWTDHNAHDPGITILELLAWLSETYGYQLDQVTDAHREKYLALVGTRPRPPTRATGRLSFDDAAAYDGRTLPAGTPIVADEPGGATERFETTADLAVTAASIETVVAEHPGGRTDRSRENAAAGRSYRTFGVEAGPDCALYLGFSADPFAGDVLDLFVDFNDDDLPDAGGRDDRTPVDAATEAGEDGDGFDAFDGAGDDRSGALDGAGDDRFSPFDGGGGDGDQGFRPSLAVAWQHCVDPAHWYRDRAWADLVVETDETNDFYRGGRVRLARPDGWETEGYDDPASILDQEEPRHWLRCVVRARGDPDERYEVPPTVDAIRTNVVRVAHRDSVAEVPLARRRGEHTTAEPDQVFSFPRSPATARTVSVGGEAWTEVTDFDGSGPQDRHYVLDAATGEVTFGDGRHGAIPGPEQSVVAHDVVYGGGPDGNVPAGIDWQVTADGFRTLTARTATPVDGGRDAESIDAALSRAVEERRVPHRAVTAEDFRDLAVRTPGVRVARAAALVGDGGPVRVVVVPYSPPAVDRPVPTSGTLDAVEAFLSERVLLTDRVRVLAPTYVPVDVTAEVSLRGGVGVDAERRAAVAALETFLDPLRGFEGEGWPFGRPVYESELYEVLEAREGVESVRHVRGSGADPLAADDGALPYPDAVSVTVRRGRDGCGGVR